MDVELTQETISAVDEFVRLTGPDDQHVAGGGLSFPPPTIHLDRPSTTYIFMYDSKDDHKDS
jgi:hypothetical protein